MRLSCLSPSASRTATASCAAFQKPLTSPSHGGPDWTEIASPHFVLQTDLGVDDAKAASVKLEEAFAELSDLGFASDEKPKTQIDVVYFRRAESYHEFAPATTSAQFMSAGPRDFERRPLALLGGDFDDRTRENLQHELTHLFVRFYYPQVPLWLNEGLARYLETLKVEDGTATLGRAPRDSRFGRGPWRRGSGGAVLIPMTEAPPVGRLLRMGHGEFYAKDGLDLRMPDGRAALKAQMANYQAAWCLVHLLNDSPKYAPAFRAYLERLRAGERDATAWAATVGAIGADQLEADYKASLTPDQVTTLRTKYSPPAPAPAPAPVRPMQDAEVHVIWARLHNWGAPEGHRAAEEDVREAALTPDAPGVATIEAWWAAEAGDGAKAKAMLHDAVLAHPENPRLWNALGWLTLAEVERPGASVADARGALAPIVEKLVPLATSAAQLDFLAHAALLNRDPDATLAYEKRAIAVDPNCIDCLGEAAKAMLAKGLGKEALEVATLAQGLAPEGATPPWLTTLVGRARTAAAGGTAAGTP